MDEPLNKVAEVCNMKFEEFKSTSSINMSSSIFLSHFGEFTQDMVNELSLKAEALMIDSGDKKGIVKRVFNILVEGLQNIRLHGEKDANGKQISFLNLIQEENIYKISMGNLVNVNHVDSMSNKIKEINSSDIDEIKKMYINTLTNGVISNKGGAGLGFITMAMKSKNQLNFHFSDIDNKLSCFTIEMILNRN